GVVVHADQYPYTAASTVLSAVFRDGRFDGPVGALDPGDVVIASAPSHPQWEGRTIPEVAAMLDTTPVDAATAVLAAEPGAPRAAHAVRGEDVEPALRPPRPSMGSEALRTPDGKPHPRLYGTFARVLGRYARELGVLTMAEGVHRMTGLPAATFGL